MPEARYLHITISHPWKHAGGPIPPYYKHTAVIPTVSALGGFHCITSLVPRPSTPNVVEGLVKLLRRMMSGGRLEAWLIAPCMHNTAVHRKCHASRRPPDVILRRSFTRPSTALGVEGLGTRLLYNIIKTMRYSGRLGCTDMYM